MDDPAKEPITPKPTPVMDIQPPQAQSVKAAPTEPEVVAEASTSAEPTTQPPEGTADQPEAKPLVAQVTAATAKRKAPIATIVVAVVVAVALAAVSVVAFMQTDKKQATTSGNTPATTQETAKPAVTTSDVDAATKEIDDSLNSANDAADFDTKSLSDTSLEL